MSRIATVLSNSPLNSFTAYDTSNASVPQISVTPGVIVDTASFGIVWIPTISGNPINIKIGTPPSYPKLIISSSATVIYLKSSINSSDGFITAVEIDSDTGGGVPPNTLNTWYLPLALVQVTFNSFRNAVILIQNILSGSQSYSICGVLPLTDGSTFQSEAI